MADTWIRQKIIAATSPDFVAVTKGIERSKFYKRPIIFREIIIAESSILSFANFFYPAASPHSLILPRSIFSYIDIPSSVPSCHFLSSAHSSIKQFTAPSSSSFSAFHLHQSADHQICLLPLHHGYSWFHRHPLHQSLHQVRRSEGKQISIISSPGLCTGFLSNFLCSC